MTETMNSVGQIIEPPLLEADATFPQCLDNQFVSRHIHGDMVRKGHDLNERSVHDSRRAEVHHELVRSLVYSSQVVINRAFIFNNDLLYQHYLPENPDELRAFAALVRDGAVLPYLFNERSFTDNVDFDRRTDGIRASRALLAEVGDHFKCLRLAADDRANKKQTDLVGTRFRQFLIGLKALDRDQRYAMAAELFDRPISEEEFERFSAELERMAQYAFGSAANLTRDQVYRDWFVVGGSDVADGQHRPSSADHPFPFELKALVDLRYNTNIPDVCNRYTFAPAGMPSRLTLQDLALGAAIAPDEVDRFVNGSLTNVNRIFIAGAQEAMDLPLLSALTMADVQQIRQLGEAKAFRRAQQEILHKPLEILDRLDKFQASFDAFQRALSKWYNETYQRKVTERKYATFVSVGLHVAGQLVVAGIDPTGLTAKVAAGTAAALIPERAKGYAVNLMVNVVDLGQKKLDHERSYSIELMRSDAELVREDILGLLERVGAGAGTPLEETGPPAEQGAGQPDQ